MDQKQAVHVPTLIAEKHVRAGNVLQQYSQANEKAGLAPAFSYR